MEFTIAGLNLRFSSKVENKKSGQPSKAAPIKQNQQNLKELAIIPLCGGVESAVCSHRAATAAAHQQRPSKVPAPK
jgi:hypothetical protein